ncbi:MAG: hypothetical protein M3Q29_09000 [Chloroflexota bacterium]|nr:hypothetical protein [Chloroflexota bacterium]
MQHAGRIRKKKGSGTTWGYTDVWAGVVLNGKRFLPLMRRLDSCAHPTDYMKHRIEKATLTFVQLVPLTGKLDPLVLATYLRVQAKRLLKREGALGRRLTPGKLAEVIRLDYGRHRRAWTSTSLT